jgi:hypothetical protein
MKRAAVLAAAAALAVAAAGCGTVNGNARPRTTASPPPSMNTSLVTAGGATWAVAVLGGSAAQHNNFWQLFVRPAGSQTWRLVTPPGVASNGGLALAGLPGQSALAAFLPSQALAFSPLATTSDSGRTWSAGVLDARLASVPDALAAAPGGSRLLALLADGSIDAAGPGAAAWSPIASTRSLSSAPAGRSCSPAAPTAVSVSPSGAPLLAVACTRPGVAGIFAYAAGTWRAAGPPLPAAEAGRRVQVLRLTSTPAGEIALLAARSGQSADLLAAWSSDGTHWTVSGPLNVGAETVRSSGFAAAGAVWALLAGGQAATIAGKNAAWRRLPQSPPDSAALALGPAGRVDALAAHGAKLTDWRLASGSGGWRKTQVLDVPIQYGSSG